LAGLLPLTSQGEGCNEHHAATQLEGNTETLATARPKKCRVAPQVIAGVFFFLSHPGERGQQRDERWHRRGGEMWITGECGAPFRRGWVIHISPARVRTAATAGAENYSHVKEKAMRERDRQMLDEYLRELRLAGRTRANAQYSLRLFFEYLAATGRECTRMSLRDAQDFQMYIATRTGEKETALYTAGSVHNIIACVTSFYTSLKKKNVIPSNPFKEIERPRQGKTLPKNILPEKKLARLLRHLKEFHKGCDLLERRNLYKAHVIAELMYSTGARVSEIANLRADDVDFVRGVVRITDRKSRQYRDVILNEYASKVLYVYMHQMRDYVVFGKNNADASRLFGSKKHLPIWLNAILKETCGKLELPVMTTHHFRHAVGFHLLRAGCDIRHIQEILGHRALSSTQIYTRVDKEDLKNIIDRYHPRALRRTDAEL